MMKKNNGLIMGFGAVVLAAVLAFLLLHPGNLITGLVWGLGIAYFGVLLYSALLPLNKGGKGSVLGRYLSGAALRYAIMIGLFCFSVFVMKIHEIGLLIGIFAGMMASTFFFLNKMRVSQLPPGSGKDTERD